MSIGKSAAKHDKQWNMLTPGGRIKWCRKQKGWSQEYLAELMNVSGAQISYYENNTNDISLGLCRELARVLDTTVDFIACGIEPEPDKNVAEIVKTYMAIRTPEARRVALKQLQALTEL